MPSHLGLSSLEFETSDQSNFDFCSLSTQEKSSKTLFQVAGLLSRLFWEGHKIMTKSSNFFDAAM